MKLQFWFSSLDWGAAALKELNQNQDALCTYVWFHALLFFICFDRLIVLFLDFINFALICTEGYFKLVILSCDVVHRHKKKHVRRPAPPLHDFVLMIMNFILYPCWQRSSRSNLVMLGLSFWWRELTSKWFLQLKDSFYLTVHQMHF